jgi:hypothetical protein
LFIFGSFETYVTTSNNCAPSTDASMEAGESRELGKKALGTEKLEAEYL